MAVSFYEFYTFFFFFYPTRYDRKAVDILNDRVVILLPLFDTRAGRCRQNADKFPTADRPRARTERIAVAGARKKYEYKLNRIQQRFIGRIAVNTVRTFRYCCCFVFFPKPQRVTIVEM